MLIAIVDITKKHTTNVQKQDIQLLKAEIESTNTKYNKLTTNTITTKTYKIVNKLIYHLNCSLKIINSPL
jgi:preprotein translocase subunit SecA